MIKHNNEIWDVVVIGGGPAGMMSAGTAGASGARVLLLEKNDTLGKKLLITGGGRCNVMNAETDTRKLLEKYGADGKYLFSTFAEYSVADTFRFFEQKQMPVIIEPGGRVFPATEKSDTVLAVLKQYLTDSGVTVRTGAPIAKINTENNTITSVTLESGEEIHARSYIIATGGKSRPETGSTGDGFVWLKNIGHSIIPPSMSLVPIALSDTWITGPQGITLSDVGISIFQFNKKQIKKRGRVLFTHFGLSGPTILNMSKSIGELLSYGDVTLSLDLFPDQDYGVLNDTLQTLISEKNKMLIKNSLTTIIPPALVPHILETTQIDGEKQTAHMTRDERIRLVHSLKKIDTHVSHLLGEDKAIVSSGGLSLDEIDFKTMRSKKYENLYVTGDVLNINRPSGGYSLQLCWTTGTIAGRNAYKK
jgi:predicted Rossmann fold flavoprotein